MIRAVQTRVLNENVEAMQEGARGRAPASVVLGDVRDSAPSDIGVPTSLCWKVTLRTITQVMR